MANPAKAAMPWVNRGIQNTHDYYDPFVNRGGQAGNQIGDIYGQMAGNPVDYYNNIANQYTQSPGFAAKRDELLRQSRNTAGAGGYAGNPQHQAQSTGLVDALMNQDFQDWYNNVYGINKEGLGGQQHLYDVGYNAASGAAGDINNLYGQQGQLAFQGAQAQNKGHNNTLQALLQLGGAGIGGYFGGPQGALAGANIGRSAGGWM